MFDRTTAGPGLPSGFPFPLATSSDEICFLSGMPALDDDGAYLAGTFEEEVTRAWRLVSRAAAAAGFDTEEIVFVQCVLADIDDYAALNAWWTAQFPVVATAPARFTFQAGALPFGCRVELQAVAARRG